jgi:hypothetical protein
VVLQHTLHKIIQFIVPVLQSFRFQELLLAKPAYAKHTLAGLVLTPRCSVAGTHQLLLAIVLMVLHLLLVLQQHARAQLECYYLILQV